jgi:cysteine-rich repeat protein
VPLFLMLDGADNRSAGFFDLTVESRTITCGDGHQDGNEECDDGGTAGGDGCSASCTLESSESEPNDTSASADVYVDPFFGMLASADDQDFVSVTTTATYSSLVVEVTDLDGESCALEVLDPAIEVRGTDGTTVLGSDDDGGTGTCSRLVVAELPPGTYFVRVRAAAFVRAAPYKLTVAIGVCGDNVVTEGEDCDDGNNEPFDTCPATCVLP